MADDPINAARSMEPPWNELRETRVLGRVLEARRHAPARRRVVIARTAVVAVAAAAAVLVALRVGLPRGGSHGAVSTGPLAPVTGTAPASATLTLPDGSRAVLSADAQVELDEQGPTRLALTQRGGAVRYDVRPDARRQFVVRAGDVTVRVLGTVFAVTQRDGWVHVGVERGRVRVEGGTRVVVLEPGDEIRLQAMQSPPALATESDAEAPASATEAERDADPGAPAEPVAEPDSAPERHATRGGGRGHAPRSSAVEALWDRVHAARAARRTDEAIAVLREILASDPGEADAATAWFNLGQLEAQRGRHGEAAAAYAACRRRAPRGSLAEDALAQEAEAWSRAGDDARARAAAERYERVYPAGARLARMRQLAP